MTVYEGHGNAFNAFVQKSMPLHQEGRLIILGVGSLTLIIPFAFNIDHTPAQGLSRLRCTQVLSEAMEGVLHDE